VKLKFILLIAISLGAASLARGQAALDQTTLGQRQNDSRDLANSLTGAPPPRYGKGEKKQEISAAELKSTSIKDTTFGGSLLNIGIQGAAPKLDEQKLHNAPSEKEKESSVSKQAPASEKESGVSKRAASASEQKESSSSFSLSDTGVLAQEFEQSEAAADTKPEASDSAAASATGNGQSKEQKASSAATDEKPSTNSAEKSSAAKPDGDH
jgi:hypothetical protein